MTDGTDSLQRSAQCCQIEVRVQPVCCNMNSVKRIAAERPVLAGRKID